MNFFYQIYYGILNAFSSPTRIFEMVAQSPPTRRAAIFGVPAALIGVLALSSYLWAHLVGLDNRIDSYSRDAELARERAGHVITVITHRAKNGAGTPLPERIRTNIEPEILEASTEDLEEKRKEYLKQWEIYLHKLIEMDGTQDKWKLQLAEVANQQGKRELVISLMNTLAPIDRPGNATAQYTRGMGYLRQKIWDRAARHFENALQSNSQFVDARVKLIFSLIQLKEFNRAKIHVDEIFEDQLLNYPSLIQMARVIYKSVNGKDGENEVLNTAVLKLRDKVSQDPSKRLYWDQLLTCYFELKNYEDAEKMLLAVQKVTDRNSPDVELHKKRLSAVYSIWATTNAIKTDNYRPEENFELLRKAYTQNSENRLALRQISIVALTASPELQARARELYDPLTDKDPPAEVHIEISNYYLARMETARKAGDQKQFAKERDNAVAELRKAFEKQPDDNQIRNNLAFLLIQQGESRIDEALRLSEKAVEKQAKIAATKDMSNFYDTLGTVQMAKAIALSKSEQLNSQKFFLDAITSFKRARVGRPDSLKLLEAQATCQQAVGNKTAADKLRERIAAIKARDNKKSN